MDAASKKTGKIIIQQAQPSIPQANVRNKNNKTGTQGVNILYVMLFAFSWLDRYTVRAPIIVGSKNKKVVDITWK